MWYIFLFLCDFSNANGVPGLDCNFESGFCGWNDSSNLIKFVYRDGKPMQFDNPFQNKTRRYFRTKSMALFKWKYRTNYFYKLGKRYGAVIYPIKPRFLCSRCFGVADLVSPTIHQSLAPRRFCYTFRITGSAFLTVSFITDYREPYLNQNIQKKHFNSNSSYFSTSCIDLDAGVEVKIVLRAAYVPNSTGYVLISHVKMADGFSWGMMTFFGIDVNDDVYAWIIVIVLPVNSALNPILYTLSALVNIGKKGDALDREMSVSLSMTLFHNRRKTVETQTDAEEQDALDKIL